MKPGLKSAVTALVMVLMGITLTGCGGLIQPTGVSEARTRTLTEAKNSFLLTEEQILALIPKHDVARTLSKTTKATMLFPCSQEDTYSWPGHNTVVLKPEVDGRKTLTNVLTTWSAQPGWTSTEQSEEGNRALVRFTHTDGRRLTVSFDSKDRSFAVVGTSACFYLATYPLPEY